MEEVFLTVKELAELKGCTERYVQKKISEGKIIAEQMEMSKQGPGRGGIQYRIPLSKLEKSLQSKFKRRLKSLQKQAAPPVIETEEPLAIDTEQLTEEERKEIVFWKNLLADWQRFRSFKANKAEADDAFVDMYNLKFPTLKLNRRTLYRKDKALREQGEAALIDKRGKHNAHTRRLTEEIWDMFEYYYLDQSRKTVKLCMTLTELNLKQLGKGELLPLPSVTTFQRAVNALPIPFIKYFRYNEKQFIGECAPYIKRMYDDLESNDIWVADNHTFDIMVGKDGKTVRVYLTAFMDVRSRKMMGWCVTDAPSSDATIYALKKGCEHHGVPKMLYTDNGREFLFHDLGGNGFRKKKKDEELKLPSILDDLGIEFKTALPRNARAKGIERAFCTVKETFSKLYESYTGGTILERPDRNKVVAKKPNELTQVTEFVHQVDTYIQGWYNRQTHSGEGMNGKCPDEVYALNLIEKRVIQQDKLNLMFMRYAKGNKGTIKVGKNGVSLKFYGQELQFWNEDLWKLYFGRDVYVRYSPDDLSSVRVYDGDMRFICTAELRTVLGYRASKEDIMAMQQENRKAVKAVKAYKKSKDIEAEEALKLVIDEAERSMGNTYDINPQIIRPIYGANETFESSQGIYPKAVGDYEEPIDWSKAVERLKKAREE